MAMMLYIDDNLINTVPDSCIYTDYAGGQSDSLQITITDDDMEVRGLEPKKGMEIQALSSNIDSGTMYLSGIGYKGNRITLRGLSLPARCYATKNYYWDNVGFYELVRDIAEETGLGIRFLNGLEVTYRDVTRIELAPVQLLQKRLELEGYAVKLHDGTLIIYDERIRENREHETVYYSRDFKSALSCETKDNGLIGSVENSYKTPGGLLINTVVYSGLEGMILRENIAVSDIDESERFSKGIMRKSNKYEYVCEGTIEGIKHSAGQTLYLADAPYGHDGINYIYKVIHDFVKDEQRLFMRRPITGGY